MKKIILILFFGCLTLVNAQQKEVDKFELNVDGYENQYVVLEFEGMTSEEIYTKLKKWFEYNIRNASYSNYSEIENEYLTYSIVDENAINVGKGFTNYIYDVYYDVELRVKPERLRVDLKLKEMPMTSYKGGTSLRLRGGLFKNNGKLRNMKVAREAFDQLESNAQDLVESLKVGVLGKLDPKKNDW